jgi:hypothetical protein
MGFKDNKKKAVEYLRKGHIDHEARDNIDKKNLLQVGSVSVEEVIDLINRTRGFQYQTDAHHLIRDITVHIFKPVKNKIQWYIKCYFIEPNLIFISVHK